MPVPNHVKDWDLTVYKCVIHPKIKTIRISLGYHLLASSHKIAENRTQTPEKSFPSEPNDIFSHIRPQNNNPMKQVTTNTQDVRNNAANFDASAQRIEHLLEHLVKS